MAVAGCASLDSTQGARRADAYATTGTEPLTGTPDELRQFQHAESQKWERVITAAGIQKE